MFEIGNSLLAQIDNTSAGGMSGILNDLQSATLPSTWTVFLRMLETFVLKIGLAALVILLAFCLARLCSKLVTALAKRVGLQQAAESSGLVQSMEQVGIKRTVPQILGLIVFWLLMSFGLMAACEILELAAVSAAILLVCVLHP